MIGFLRQNLFWMLLSIVMSIGLWLIVTVEQNPRESNWFTSVSVEVLNVPTNLTPRSTPDPVRVLISAPQDVWRGGGLGQDKIRATVDASASSPGLVQLPVTASASSRSDRRTSLSGCRPTARRRPASRCGPPTRLPRWSR
jgi:hypothetical protein